ncbi:hypothetical protein FQN52_006331 [Onygenales sp. PD_12]|nr:hypothetical protein FQN52_006331 [Onygenales sp. PD_12]
MTQRLRPILFSNCKRRYIDPDAVIRTLSADIYCPFCGISVLPDSTIDGSMSLRGSSRRSWCSEARAILCNQDSPSPSLTGIGVLYGNRTLLSSLGSKLLAPLDSELSYNDTDWVENVTLLQKGEYVGGYGFHDSCWRLLLARLSHVENQIDIIGPIFRLFYSIRCHRYGEAADDWGRVPHQDYFDESSVPYSDPFAIPFLDKSDISPTEFSQLNTPKQAENTLPRFYNGGGSSGSLGILPLELIHAIMTYLPLTQVANMRLVCRMFASLAKRENLPQSFWKSRFMLNREHDYLFPDFSSTRNWSQFFDVAQSHLRSGHKSVVNRKRIRSRLEPFARKVEADIANPTTLLGLEASSFHPQPGQPMFLANDATTSRSTAFDIIASFSSYLEADDYQGFKLPRTHHEHFYRISQFPCRIPGTNGNGKGYRINVSTFGCGENFYITGIAYMSPQSSGELEHGIGYCSLSSEIQFQVSSPANLETIEVTFSPSGLTGIRFMFDICSSPWIGRKPGGKEISHGLLRLPRDSDSYYLALGLNFINVTTIGLVKPIDPDISGCKYTPCVDERSVGDLESYLWVPEVPRDRDIILGSLEPKLDHRVPVNFEPRFDIYFGGPKGLLLSHLTRVVVHMLCDDCLIIGMTFYYTDHSVNFGSSGETEIPFLIDGPNGERIISLEVLNDDYCGMRGLKIGTNYGRSMLFASLSSSAGYVESIKCPQLPHSSMITGFVATREVNQKNFTKIGLQGQVGVREPFILPTRRADPVSRIFEEQVAYDRGIARQMDVRCLGNFSTYASLVGVRRIRASTGLSGHFRSPSYISALRFDYHDEQCYPAIIGQWINEHDSFELEIGEKIQSLQIWLRKRRFTVGGRRTQGRVTTLKFDTTANRSKVFGAPEASEDFDRMIRQHYQYGARGDLVAISWVFNRRCDRIRAIPETKPSESSLIVIPELQPPHDQTNDIMFDKILPNGNHDILKTIVAHFYREIITGLTFVYRSGQAIDLGYTATDEEQVMHIPENSGIVCISTIQGQQGMNELKFHVGTTVEDSLSQPLQITTFKTNSMNIPPKTKANRYIRSFWYPREKPDGIVSDSKPKDMVYIAPHGSKLVGLCVSCENNVVNAGIYGPV